MAIAKVCKIRLVGNRIIIELAGINPVYCFDACPTRDYKIQMLTRCVTVNDWIGLQTQIENYHNKAKRSFWVKFTTITSALNDSVRIN